MLLPFSSQVLGDHGGDTAAVILYAINLIGVVLAGMLLFADAHRAGLTRTSSEDIREGRRRAFRVVSIFLVSIPLAFVNADLAPLCWLILFVVPAAAGRFARRERT